MGLAIIGALPLGLVNLSVLNTSYQHGRREAMLIAHGAAWVEVLFGSIALVAGSLIMDITSDIRFARILVIAIPALLGVIFLLKKQRDLRKKACKSSGFLKGIILNIVSVQVLIYWLIALAYLNAVQININTEKLLFFGIGIWAGKMLVLWMYAAAAGYILSRSELIASNMNRIIGVVLLISSAIQIIK